jgi:hypothetical protein
MSYGIGIQFPFNTPGGVGTNPFLQWDLETGIPWPAVVPTDTSLLGAYGFWPLKLTRSQLAYCWHRVRKWNLTTTHGAAAPITVDQVFGTHNPFAVARQSLSFPFQYQLQTDGTGYHPSRFFFGTGIVGVENLLQSDGAGGYYPYFQFGDSNSPYNCDTASFSASTFLSTFHLQDDGGVDLATCQIRGDTPYGDVTMKAATLWF